MTRNFTWALIAGAAGTAVAGAFIQLLVVPTTDVTIDRWSYPWAAGPFVVVSLVYSILHLLVAVGLVGFGRVGVGGTSRPGALGQHVGHRRHACTHCR